MVPRKRCFLFFSCDACGDSVQSRAPRPGCLPGRYVFNYAIKLDTFHAYDVTKQPAFFFLNIICEGTSFQVVVPMGPARGSPATRPFLLCWTSWADNPERVTVDLGKEWMREFSDNLKMQSVQIDLNLLETPRIIGKCERHGGVWKNFGVSGEDEVEETASIITQVKNELDKKLRFSPSQWVLGYH